MHDIMTIGSATIDIFMKSDQFHLQPSGEGLLLCQEYGGKLDISEFEVQSGGAGTNTAVGFARMGFKTAAVVEIGKDIFAQMVWDELKREGVDTEYIVSEKGEKTAVSTLLVSGEGGRSALTFRGASSQLEARDLPWQALLDSRWIHLSNVSANKELLLRLFENLRTTSIGLSWNPGHKELELLAAGKISFQHIPCDILIMNKEEWDILEKIHAQILDAVPCIVVTDGKKGGTVWIEGEYEQKFEADVVEAVQETGAGDAFSVGFVSAHLLGKKLLECCEWGVKNSASVVQHMGAKTGLMRRKEMETKIQ